MKWDGGWVENRRMWECGKAGAGVPPGFKQPLGWCLLFCCSAWLPLKSSVGAP